MDKQSEHVWATRDLPILRTVTCRIDHGDRPVTFAQAAVENGLDVRTVEHAALALKRAGLVHLDKASGGGHTSFMDVTSEAYVRAGLHPGMVFRLLQALETAAAQAADPVEKSRLRKLATQADGVSRDTLAAVLGDVITSAARG